MGLNTYPCSPFPPSTVDMEEGDVTEQQKALIETIPGKAQKADIAPEFSTETVYNAGDLVYYNGALYEFTADHAAGAWSTDDTQEATIDGSLDQLKSGLTNLDNEVNGDATVYPYADVITIEDAVPSNLADCTVKIEPDQDLHGYDHPWVGGADLNKFNPELLNRPSYSVGYDESVTVLSADNTNWVDVDAIPLNAGTYTISLFSNDTIIRTQMRTSEDSYASNIDFASEYTFTLTSDGGVKLKPASGSNLPITIKIQIETGQTAHPWQPYTNICPISGHTEASVQRDGKNLLDDSVVGLYQATAAQAERYGYAPFVLKAGTYTISYITTDPEKLLFITYMTDWSYTELSPSGTTITLTQDTEVFVRSGLAYTSSEAEFRSIFSNAQVERGTQATAYTPYIAPNTYTITFGQTVYGGTVDFDSGVMTVDREYYSISSTSDFRNNQGSFPSSAYVIDVDPVGLSNGDIISNKYVNGVNTFINSSGKIRINTYDSYESKDAAFSGELSGAQFVYELATPFTIQLTPKQIQLLKGTNTITASTGQISVTVNGVSGSIGSVQEQVNETDAALAEIAEQLPTAPTTDGAYVLTVTVASGTPTYSWESAI